MTRELESVFAGRVSRRIIERQFSGEFRPPWGEFTFFPGVFQQRVRIYRASFPTVSSNPGDELRGSRRTN
jgi:hypothetical protein